MFDDSPDNSEEPPPAESRKHNKPRAGGVPRFVWWGILPGAGLLLLLIVLIFVLTSGKSKPADLIVGTWASSSGMEATFNSDGTADLGGADRSLRFVKWRFIDDNTMKVTSIAEPHISFEVRITVHSKNEMTMSGPEGGRLMKRVR